MHLSAGIHLSHRRDRNPEKQLGWNSLSQPTLLWPLPLQIMGHHWNYFLCSKTADWEPGSLPSVAEWLTHKYLIYHPGSHQQWKRRYTTATYSRTPER